MDKFFILLVMIAFAFQGLSFNVISNNGDSINGLYVKGLEKVNHCTPWDHVKCVVITGSEVYEDGRDGKKVRHWWRMSYIGQACKQKYGNVFGVVFEGFFVVPHYTGVAVGSGFGYFIYLVQGGPRDPEKVLARKKKRLEKKKIN